jgi:hypothetical protein
MARKRLVECSFLIPIQRDEGLSDGGTHSRRAWNWLENELMQFGGATRAGELYHGWYLDPDTRRPVRDRSKKYLVALTREDVERLRSLLVKACVVFEQKCIYLSVAGQVEFVERPSHEAD